MEKFPELNGLKMDARMTPRFNTKVSTASSGYEFRINLQDYPLWDWQISFEFLRNRRDGVQDLETIQAFFLERGGAFETFLFDYRETHYEEGITLGIGNGVVTDFNLIKTTMGFEELAGGVHAKTDVVLYVDDVVIDSADFELIDHRTIRFNTAPTAATEITADYKPLYRVRFAEDSLDFENFMHQLWELNQLELKGVFL